MIFICMNIIKKFLLFTLISSMLLVGACSKKSSGTYTKVDAAKIENLVTNKVPHVIGSYSLRDEYYAVPDINWVKDQFSKQYYAFLFDNNLRTYVEGANDCDNFALYARSKGHTMYNNDGNRIEDAALAIGEIRGYFSGTGGVGGHVLNFFVVSDNGTLKVVFYEPFVMQIVEVDVAQSGIFGWEM